MDQTLLLVIVSAALVIVLVAWGVRELVPAVRRRRHPDEDRSVSDAAAELVPLLLQPVAALVKQIGRNRRSIESLVGPDGTVSLLFCDIEGSTRLNQKLGDERWVEVIRAYDDIADRTTRRHHGKIVKTEGDGFLAAFPTPKDAVDAAVALGGELDDSEAIDVRLAVRVGAHTGKVVTERDDVFGTNVAMTARIAAAARGDEVLVSEAVRDELAAGDTFEFHRRRARRFKGLPGRHPVYAVTGAGTSR